MGRLGSMGRLHSMRRRDDPSSRGEAYDMGDGLTGESYPQATTSWLFML